MTKNHPTAYWIAQEAIGGKTDSGAGEEAQRKESGLTLYTDPGAIHPVDHEKERIVARSSSLRVGFRIKYRQLPRKAPKIQRAVKQELESIG